MKGDVLYRTLDDLAAFNAAKADPHLFVNLLPKNGTLVIDEVQKVPELLSAIKLVVDNSNRPGQFLLTGSANILTLPTVQESLAGRVGKVRLRPMARGEVLQKKPQFLTDAFDKKFHLPKTQETRDELIDLIFAGGYPEALRLPAKARKDWHNSYIDALIENDLNSYANLRQKDTLADLLKILAAWSSKFMDISAIGAGLALDRRTLANYISALTAFYLIEPVSPWLKTDYERVNKMQKLFMTDTGMMTALLGWKPSFLNEDADKAGKAFETLAFTELAAQIDAFGSEYRLYHYRDREKREIDFLVERDDGHILAIEVKSGLTIRKSDFKPIEWFRANIAKKNPVYGIILYTGRDVMPFGDDCWAIPFSALWG